MAKGRNWAVLDRLIATIESRRDMDPAKSYAAKQLARPRLKVAQKLGEEAVETALAAVAEGPDELKAEAADLLFHLLLLLAHAEIDIDDVLQVLAAREGGSGLTEKATRKPS